VSQLSCEIKFDFVYEAPAPVFARLNGPHDRVLGGMEVLCRMFVLRGIAATDMATHRTEPQMNPSVAHLETLATLVGRWFQNLDLIRVSAPVHDNPP